MSELTKERLAALLMTSPDWAGHYTASLRMAEWVLLEAERLGWSLDISDKPPNIDAKPIKTT